MFPMTTLFESVESCISILWFVMETQRTVFTPYFLNYSLCLLSLNQLYTARAKDKRGIITIFQINMVKQNDWLVGKKNQYLSPFSLAPGHLLLSRPMQTCDCGNHETIYALLMDSRTPLSTVRRAFHGLSCNLKLNHYLSHINHFGQRIGSVCVGEVGICPTGREILPKMSRLPKFNQGNSFLSLML